MSKTKKRKLSFHEIGIITKIGKLLILSTVRQICECDDIESAQCIIDQIDGEILERKAHKHR